MKNIWNTVRIKFLGDTDILWTQGQKIIRKSERDIILSKSEKKKNKIQCNSK